MFTRKFFTQTLDCTVRFCAAYSKKKVPLREPSENMWPLPVVLCIVSCLFLSKANHSLYRFPPRFGSILGAYWYTNVGNACSFLFGTIRGSFCSQRWYIIWLKKWAAFRLPVDSLVYSEIICLFRERFLILAIAYMIWNSAFHFLIFVDTNTVITTVSIVMLRLVQNRHSTYFAASAPARTILTVTGTARRICNNVLSIRQNRTIHKSLIPESILFIIFATLLPSTLSAVRRTAKKNLQKQVP